METTMHLDDEQLQRMMHGELAPASRTVVHAHLDACADCRERLDQEARDEERIFSLLRAIDGPVPALGAPPLDSRARSRRHPWAARVAAMLGGLAIAGAAYAAPGSPVRAFVRRLISHPPRLASVRVAQPARVEAAPAAGIAIAPGRHLTIDVTAAPSSGVTTVGISDGNEVIVRAFGGRPAFRSEVDRLVVANTANVAALVIDIPRSAPSVDVRLGGRRLLRKSGAAVVSAAPHDSAGRYVLEPGR
jgi:hypothetical protein